MTLHLTRATAESIIERVRTGGGLTVAPGTGEEPTQGYCINEVGECPKIPADQFFDPDTGQAAIETFLTDYADWFKPGTSDTHHIGFWHDRENNVVVLDRVNVVNDLEEALRIGRARNQRSMWDVENQREIAL